MNPYYCQSEPIRTLFRYSPTTNTWSWKRPAPHYHANGAGGVINGKFYVAGGSNNYGSSLEASLDRYDPATDTWTTLAPLPTAGAARGAALQGKLFVVVRTTTGRRAYAYDPATNKWTAKTAPHWDHDDIVPITWVANPISSGSAASTTSTPTTRRIRRRCTRRKCGFVSTASGSCALSLAC
jgi:Kelch motif protein